MTSVRVANYRSIADTGVVPLGPVTILIGKNNTGKSAFLRSIFLVQEGAPWDVSDLRLRSPSGSVDCSFDQSAPTKLLQPFSDGILPAESVLNCHFGPGGVGANLLVGEQSYGVGLFTNARPEHYIVPVLARRRAERYDDLVNAQYGKLVQVSDRGLTSRILAFTSADHPEAKAYRQLLTRLFGFSIATFLVDNGQQPGIAVSSSEGLLLEKMGDGVSGALRIVTELADSVDKLFLLEEPENDLHPDALRALLEFVVASIPANQFIVSTHSDFVLRHLGSVEGAMVYETSTTTDLIPTTAIEPVQSRESRLRVLADLGYDPELPAGWLLFEESTAERVCRQVLIPHFAPGLAVAQTVGGRGASKVVALFEDLHRLVLFALLSERYRRKAWVLVDNDTAGTQVVEKLRNSFSDWPADNFGQFDKASFEEYYPSRFDEDRARLLVERDWRRAQEIKGKLAEDLCQWVESDPHGALPELEQSAAGAISQLRRVEKLLLESS
jgi:hypothetical protein